MMKTISRTVKATRERALLEALDVAGGLAAVGRAFEMTGQAIGHWKRRGYCPAEYAVDLADLTGGKVPVERLRPDVFRPARRRNKAGVFRNG